jgi:hypothetical protein
MDFWRAILGLARRKVLFITLLVSAIALGLAGYSLTPLRYVSSTTMVLVTPALGGTLSQDPTAPIDLTNPMLSFSNNLKTASAILIQAVNTPEAIAEVGAPKGGPTKVTVDDGRTNPELFDNNGPFLYVVGESTSSAEARGVVVRAQKWMRQDLVDRQKTLGAPPETYLTIVDVVAPTTPKVTRTKKIKVGALAAMLALVSGLTIAYAWQRLRAGQRRVAGGDSLSATHNDDVDASRDQDGLDTAVDQRFADEIAARVGGDSSARLQHVHEAEVAEEHVVNAVFQRAVEVQVAVADVAADGLQVDEHAADVELSMEPKHIVYASEAEQTKEGWDLYIVEYPPPGQMAEQTKEGWDLYTIEYPPPGQMTVHGSEHDEFDWTLDWSVEGLESVPGSVVVLQNDNVASAITRGSRPEQVKANAIAAGTPLASETLSGIDEAPGDAVGRDGSLVGSMPREKRPSR